MTSRTPIERLLRPKSVAVAGASATKKTLANIVLDNLHHGRFSGDIHVVHPKAPIVETIATTPSFDAMPEGVDCVVLAMPASAVLEAVEICARKDVGGIIIFSAGFAELGDEGKETQARIRQIAHDAGMVIEGPNCLGMMNYVDGIHLTFSATEDQAITAPGIGIVSQSGAMAVVLRGAFLGRDRPVSYAISTGNEAANGIEDFLEFLIEDAKTRVIAMIGEQIRDPERFLALAGRARQIGKPILLLHPGKSSAAREAARTHTGAMAGDNSIMRARVRGKGVTIVETLEELVDLTEFVSLFGFPEAGGLGVIGESGALSALLLDYCEEEGVALPEPEGEVAETLDAMAPGFIRAANPLDLTAQAMINPEIYATSLKAMSADPRIGALMLSISLTSRGMARRKAPPVLEILGREMPPKPLIFAMVGDDADIGDDIIKDMRALGVPFYRSPERAVRTIARLASARPETDERPLPDISAAATLAPGMRSEATSKELLSAIGLPIPPFRLAKTVDEALSAAADLGYPVVIKAQSPDLPHKSDAGGVVLGLGDEADLRAGWQRLHDNLAANAPGLALEGVLVESMAPRGGVELIVGARNDPQWGGVVLVGLGGVYTELFKDVALLPATCTKAQVIAALKGLKGARLLEGYRGGAAVDLAAVADAVCRLGDFVALHPEVAEVEINPLVVYPEGARALDALISVK